MTVASETARRLVEAYRGSRRVAASVDNGPADAGSAYAAQAEVWRAMAGDARATAWKVAAASRDSEPIAAPVFPRYFSASPARFPADAFRAPGVEAEIAVRFGRDLPARPTPYARDEILAAVAGLHVAMEVVDTRLADPEAAGPWWRLADNLLNGGLVVGTAIPRWRELDFARLVARVSADGRLLAETLGRPPLDDLFHCLPWWIDHVGGARAGDIVTTGAWNGMHRIDAPATVTVEFEGVGRAEARLDQAALHGADTRRARHLCCKQGSASVPVDRNEQGKHRAMTGVLDD
jgi:2-keto-4-pentenoate hydratase